METLPSISALPLTDTALLNVPAPVAKNVPPTETLLAVSIFPLTDTASLNVAAFTTVTVPTTFTLPDTDTLF